MTITEIAVALGMVVFVVYILVETMDFIGIVVRATRKWLARKATPEGRKRG